MATMRLKAPEDYSLSRDVCSYGYFLLAPNRWSPAERALTRVIDLPGGAVGVEITQPGGPGAPVRVALDRSVPTAGRAAIERQIVRMLRLDEDAATIRAFHRVDPRFRAGGRGRLFRSPTFFEDVLKTVTSCNVTWPGTVMMNRRLCEALGARASGEARGFPSAATLARARPAALRGRCRVGYRDERIVALARMFARGGVDEGRLTDPATPDEEVRDTLLEWPGVGPYAAANIMQLLGRYSHLPLDTESVRHGRTVLGFRGTPARVMRQVRAHFAPFGGHAFRSYWFELWEFYESRHGPAWTWERDSTGKLFTAALLAKAPVAASPARNARARTGR